MAFFFWHTLYIIRNDTQNYYIIIICIVQYYTSACALIENEMSKRLCLQSFSPDICNPTL